MNSFETIKTDYIKPSRTIETVLVSNFKSKQLFYVYNYEGYSFRVFETVPSLINFFEENIESNFHFDSENKLDDFLSKVSFT
jgi:hypothetical protein